MTEQELLDLWVQAELLVIGHTSGSFAADAAPVYAAARDYALTHGLVFNAHLFEGYMEAA